MPKLARKEHTMNPLHIPTPSWGYNMGSVRELRILIAVCAVLFGLCTFTALSGTMSGTEASIFQTIYNMSDGLRPFALAITQFGTPWALLGLVGLLFVVRWNPRSAILISLSGTIAIILVSLFKFVVNRERPLYLLQDIVPREGFVQGSGYPSAHTALITVMILILFWKVSSAWRWAAPVMILLVGWSRIYLGVHAPLDVLGGFLLGALVVLLFLYLEPRMIRKS